MIEHKNNSSMLQNVLASTIRWLFRLKTKGTNNAYLACRDFIDHQFYARQADDLWKTAGDMSLHYHLLGWKRGLDPHPLLPHHGIWHAMAMSGERRSILSRII